MRSEGPEVAVRLVSAPDCHLCVHAHEVLVRLVNEGLPLVVEECAWNQEDGERLVCRDGVPFPPALYVDGVLWGYGRISERALRKRLAQQ